jgi:glyoxylase I family protein
MSNPVRLRAVHHIAVICSDYPRSRDFYTRVLGLRVIRETHRAERCSWKLDLEVPGGARIELFSFPDPPERVSNPEARGLRHLAFEVDDPAAEAARLTALGVRVEPIRVDPTTGKRYTFFADPDGLPLELYEA